MALTDLTHEAVESALEEAESLGRETFLHKYGFGHARAYFVRWKGKTFDSKAIVGAAHGYLPGKKPLLFNDFSGGETTVATCLRELGFEIVPAPGRNPAWSRDELILALDLYVRFKGNPPGKSSAEIVELSKLLNRLALPSESHDGEFRNPNGVYMKLMNFRRFDPVYQAQGKTGLNRGNQLEKIVWDEFVHDPGRLRGTARAIGENIEEPAVERLPWDPGIEEADEGRVLTNAHLVRERSRKLVQAKKAEVLKLTGNLVCEACGFDFEKTYGERGRGFIEVHHALPVHQLIPGSKTRLSDLHVLCANCHRMIHSRRPWLTIDSLKEHII